MAQLLEIGYIDIEWDFYPAGIFPRDRTGRPGGENVGPESYRAAVPQLPALLQILSPLR